MLLLTSTVMLSPSVGMSYFSLVRIIASFFFWVTVITFVVSPALMVRLKFLSSYSSLGLAIVVIVEFPLPWVGLILHHVLGFVIIQSKLEVIENVFSSPSDLNVNSFGEIVNVVCSPPFPFGLLGSSVPLSLPQPMKKLDNCISIVR